MLVALTEKHQILSYKLRFGRVGKRGLIHGHRFRGHSCRALAIGKAYVGSPITLIALTEKKLSSILRFGRVGKKGLIHGHHFMVHSCRALAIEII